MSSLYKSEGGLGTVPPSKARGFYIHDYWGLRHVAAVFSPKSLTDRQLKHRSQETEPLHNANWSNGGR